MVDLSSRLSFPGWERGGFKLVGVVVNFVFPFIESTSKPAGLSGKRRRTVTLATVAQSQTLRVESSGDEGAAAAVGAYTPQQAALFGEAVASELETRAMEPFVAS